MTYDRKPVSPARIMLDVQDLHVGFDAGRGLFARRPAIRAVDGVSFSLDRGRTLGLVGESGCGKSTTGLALTRLVQATSGRAMLDDTDLLTARGEALRRMRQRIQIVFQDPFSSLNPRLTAAALIAEPLEVLGLGAKAERQARVAELLGLVGLSAEQAGLYPHQFSGGQRQRIGIARALAPGPEILICDEPVSALDVAIQAQILNLLVRIQRENGFAMLFISHDLSVVRYVCDDVIVMYLGRIVERASTADLFGVPLHPYTKALLSAVPSRDPDRKRERIRLTGDVPSPANVPSGCAFRTRCPFAQPRCGVERPELRTIRTNHETACHFAEALEHGDAQLKEETSP